MICTKFRITDIRFAVVFMALFAIGAGSISTYIGAMITTIEKRFGYNSMEIGLIMGANDIGYLLTVTTVAYVASRKERKSLVLSLSAVGLWLSSMIYTFPFVIFGARFSAESLKFVNSSDSKSLCTIYNGSNVKDTAIVSSDIKQKEKYVSLMIYIIAGILNGVASTPFWNVGIAFLDEMAGPVRSGISIGFLFSMRALSPIFGFLLGSYVLKFHESLKINVREYLPGQKDFKWIGAWWLGWLILGFFVLLQAPFLFLLKAKPQQSQNNNVDLKEDFLPKNEENCEDNTKQSNYENIKELFLILKESIRNRIFVFLVSGMIFEILSFVCLYTFFTKFLEFHYRVSASMTNVLTAFCLAGSSVMSSLISGSVSHFFKTSIRNMNLYHAIVNTVAALAFPLLFIFTCQSAEVIGLSEGSRRSLCSKSCTCQIKKLEPICFSSKTIFSPCLAGCRQQVNETFFSNCGCGINEFAKKGFCEEMCPTVYGFLITFFIIKIVGSMASVQFTQVLLRLTEPKNKAIYLSIIGMVFGICGFVFPPLAGLVLDTACKHRDINSFGSKSQCLIYDNDQIRYIIIGVTFALQIPSSILYILAWIYTPVNYSYENNKKTTAKVQSEITTMT